jgi:hypothetical protein
MGSVDAGVLQNENEDDFRFCLSLGFLLALVDRKFAGFGCLRQCDKRADALDSARPGERNEIRGRKKRRGGTSGGAG